MTFVKVPSDLVVVLNLVTDTVKRAFRSRLEDSLGVNMPFW